MANYITSTGAQQISISMSAGTSPQTVTETITSVGSLVDTWWTGYTTSSTQSNRQQEPAVYVTPNSTTATATRANGASYTVLATGSCLDGTSSLYKSIQYGTVNLNGSPATITAVNLNYATVQFLGFFNNGNSGMQSFEPQLSFASSTSVQATLGLTPTTAIVYFVVREYQPAVMNQNVQSVSITGWTGAAAGSTNNYTINSVNKNNAMTCYANWTSNVGTGYSPIMTQITSATNFAAQVGVQVNSSNTKTVQCYVIEFISGILTQAVQRGIVTINSTSVTATISSSPTNTSVINWLGAYATIYTPGNMLYYATSVALTNATTATWSVNTFNSTLYGSFEVATFPAYVAPSSGDCILFGMIF